MNSPEAVVLAVFQNRSNVGCVSVGIDNDTAEFAVNSIRRWMDVMGRPRYPTMNQLLITADSRGSRLTRTAVQGRTAKTGRRNRLDAADLPLSPRDIEVKQDRAPDVLPHHPKLAGQAADQRTDHRRADCFHHQDIKVSDDEMAALNIKGDKFHPEWNYTISPKVPP